MNNFFKISLLAAVIALTGCKDESQNANKPVTLESEQQKIAYSLGVAISKQINLSLEEQQKLGIELDSDLVIKGISDGLKETVQLGDEAQQTTLAAFREDMETRAQEARAAEVIKLKADGEAWLAEIAKQEGVKTTDSGLMYKVINQGDGPKPTVADRVKVHYRGTLPNGLEFDSSYARKETTTFELGTVLKGWIEGLQLMPVGSKYELYIPAELAYGEAGAGRVIGPNTPLKFEVELFEINPKVSEPAE